MDYIKSSLGYGAQSGQEPISGETGKGTPDQPYDAGNVAGQSGAPAAEATSTNPTGTTQYDTGTSTAGEKTNTSTTESGTHQFDTGETPNTNAADSDTRDSSKLNTTENLAPGVGGGDSTAAADAPADSQPLGSTSGGASKGTDEGPGPDEQVRSNQGGPGSDSQTSAQDTFFKNAHLDKNKPAESPKVPDEITNKDPFGSSSGADDPSSETAANTAKNTDPAPPASSTTNTTSDDNVGISTAEKNYKTADTEPHPESSEVLSSATPGAAIGSAPLQSNDQPDTSNTTQDPSSTTRDTGNTGYGNPTTSSSAGAPESGNFSSAADTEFISPKTQPTEAEGGLAGVSHNTGNAPSAPATGTDVHEDPSLGASQGQGKKKMGDRIKEKLHIGKKREE